MRTIRVQPNRQEERCFDSIDAAYRWIIDSRIRVWSMFEGEQFLMSSDNTFIPAIDGEREAAA